METFPTRYAYRLSAEQQQRFADIFLLRIMINGQATFGVDLPGNDSFLQSILTRLCTKGWATIDTRKAVYTGTQAGREPLQKFEQRYYDFQKTLDVPYYATDLAYGDFAHTYIEYFSSKENLFQLMSDERWRPFMSQFSQFLMAAGDWTQESYNATFGIFVNLAPWEDMRVAVAEYQKIDALEIMFMALLNRGYFDQPRENWQFDLYSGWYFQKVEELANKSYHLDQLVADGATSEEIMQNIIMAGTQLMMLLVQREAEREQQYASTLEQERQAEQAYEAQIAQSQLQTVTTTQIVLEVSYVTVVEPVYYAPSYYDVYLGNPYYVSPIWYDPWYW